MTVNGTNLPRNLAPGSSPRDGRGYDAHELYPPSVSNNVTPSPIPPKDTPNNHSQRSALLKQGTRLHGSPSSRPDKLSSNALGASGLRLTPDITSPASNDVYSAVTEDGLLVVPSKSSVLGLAATASPLDVSSLKDEQPEASSSSRASAKISPTNTGILQPKPIRPMKGVSLNLQVQAAVMAQTRQDSIKAPKSKRKSHLLKNLNLGISKGKTRVLIDPYTEDTSSYGESLASKFDDSFMLVDFK